VDTECAALAPTAAATMVTLLTAHSDPDSSLTVAGRLTAVASLTVAGRLTVIRLPSSAPLSTPAPPAAIMRPRDARPGRHFK